MTIKKIILFITLVFTSLTVFANSMVDKVRLQKLTNNYLHEHRIDEHISAVAITLQYPGNRLPLSAYSGHTSYNDHKSINANNLFHIGSITKSFISAIILQLEGDASLKFSIEDPIDKYFPHYKKWHGVTIRQLMNMTSGIPDYSENDDFAADFTSNPYRHRTPDELLNFSYNLKTHFEPGTQYNYSNANYVLLGLLIEKLTGNSLAYELQSRFIEPLKLNHTYYSDDRYTKRNLVHCYMFKKEMNEYIPMGRDATDFTMSVYGASGAMIANTPDITLWVKELFTPGKILTKQQIQKLSQIVSEKTGKPLKVPTKDDPNGFGLGITYIYIPDTGDFAYAYEGMTLGGRALYVYIPARNMIISATVNSSVSGIKDNEDHLKDLIMNAYKLVIDK